MRAMDRVAKKSANTFIKPSDIASEFSPPLVRGFTGLHNTIGSQSPTIKKIRIDKNCMHRNNILPKYSAFFYVTCQLVARVHITRVGTLPYL